MNLGLITHVYNYYSRITTSISSITSFNFHLINLCLLGVLLTANFLKWLVFGKLTNNEVRNLKDKISYTTWEFFFGFIIFYHNNGDKKLFLCNEINIPGGYQTPPRNELTKFAGLFLCVLLLKCFHYLSVDRVFTIFQSNTNNNYYYNNRLLLVRFGVGLILLNFIDGLLIYKFITEMMHSKYPNVLIEDNILITIFGFEIINMFPLILLTTVKYGLNCFEYWKYDGMLNDHYYYNESSINKWKDFKLKMTFFFEFSVNFIRFLMTITFLIAFLYLYTFPLHILPSSYLSLRVLIIKTRSFINLKKRQFKIQKLIIPKHIKTDEKCIICFDEFTQDSDSNIRMLTNCNHTFHYSCLRSWVDISSSCPICRDDI